MDAIDIKILGLLQRNGRETWSGLADATGLTGPAVAERVRKLQEQQIITGFAALLNPSEVDLGLTAFIAVTLQAPDRRGAFLERIASLEQVQECHHVTGDDDYLLKVRCSGTAGLEQLITEQLKSGGGILRTRTTIVLRSEKDSPLLPLGIAPGGPDRS
jgi:Lrp/AsnC family leucine-responsive transcriptional regulator